MNACHDHLPIGVWASGAKGQRTNSAGPTLAATICARGLSILPIVPKEAVLPAARSLRRDRSPEDARGPSRRAVFAVVKSRKAVGGGRSHLPKSSDRTGSRTSKPSIVCSTRACRRAHCTGPRSSPRARRRNISRRDPSGRSAQLPLVRARLWCRPSANFRRRHPVAQRIDLCRGVRGPDDRHQAAPQAPRG